MKPSTLNADRIESNWLPSQKGVPGVTIRLYGPKNQIPDGRWNPPEIWRTEEQSKELNTL
jgi:hypothetical protein